MCRKPVRRPILGEGRWEGRPPASVHRRTGSVARTALSGGRRGDVAHAHGSRQGRRSKEQRPPSRVAVFTLYYSTVCSACIYLHRIVLFIGDRSSSNDRASIVGGALERPFQLLRNQIDHHIPSCAAVVW